MTDAPVWERDGRDWPNRSASRFVQAAGIRWHIQEMGSGPLLLLVHGTGAATHSWRGLMPLLAQRFTVLAMDLPGHGFTETLPGDGLSLPGMARALTELLRTLDARPEVVVGHSAGAAILIRMCLDGAIAPRLLVSLNGALLPLLGVPGHLFSPIAKLMVAFPMATRLFAWRAADRRAVAQMLRSTGSSLDAEGVEMYSRLARTSGHTSSALRMMASWDLRRLERELPRLQTPLILVAASNDRTIPASDAVRVHRLVPAARLVPLPHLGHLAHEERPDLVAEIIFEAAAVGRQPVEA
jgi:magnesium chelatase accessory protein